MPPIEIIELAHDGTLTTTTAPGDAPASPPVVPQGETGAPAETAPPRTGGVQGESAPPPADAPPPDDASLAASPSEGEDADVSDDAATVPFVNRRIKQLSAKRRETEKQLAEERTRNAIRQAQLEARLDTLTRVLSGSAPDVPASPPQPTGPPQAEQFERHEEFIQAAANYAADQRIGQERQQAQQIRFLQDLMSREQAFKQAHPDFDTVVRASLLGKLSPVLQQALMLMPDGPAVSYTLAHRPELVQHLNQLPPPLILVELGRLSGPGGSSSAPQDATRAGVQGSANGQSTAPPAVPAAPLPEPMAPVGGGGSTVQPTYSDSMDQRQYEAWRARTSNLPYLRKG